ncbi:hypothetical protein PG991_002903 [Apiospora marii]|uniref:Uncharacterized protein n=1 Tax=Apiospora marii TaxID=335849 RepID=A0ABR1SGP5_9PEZI
MDFFRFPGEVRNMVYKELLVNMETTIQILDLRPWRPELLGVSSEIGRELGLGPVILQVSKQARAEGGPFLYSLNRFDLRNRLGSPLNHPHRCATLMAQFARKIGRENAQCIRHVIIQFPFLNQKNGCTMGWTWMEEPPHIVQLLASEYGNAETVGFRLGEDGIIVGRGLDCARETNQGVSLIDAELRSIPSLKNIWASIYEECHHSDEDITKKTIRQHCSARRHGRERMECTDGF